MTKEYQTRSFSMINNPDWFLENLKNKIPFAYVRFNDGEMMGIARVGSVVARGDQYVDQALSKALKDAILHRQENYYIGIPCSICFPAYSKLAKEMVEDYNLTTSAVILTNKNWKRFADSLPKVMEGRRMLWVSGKDQDPEKLKDYGLDIVKTIRLSNKNSWKHYDELKELVPQFFEPGDVVGISLGPTARILCKYWFEKYPEVTFLDMGSLLDPITKNVWFSAHKGWDETGFNLLERCTECN